MCEVLVSYPKHSYTSMYPRNVLQITRCTKRNVDEAHKKKQTIRLGKDQEIMSHEYDTLMNLEASRPPVFLETHPLRGLAGSKPVYSSTPDLNAQNDTGSSSESLDTERHGSREHLHRSHEAIHEGTSGSRSMIHPGGLKDHPSTRYEWSTTVFSEQNETKRYSGVSEGYCKLRILSDPCSSATDGNYSVLDIGAIEPPATSKVGESSDNEDDYIVDERVKNHHYFTLEVMDDKSNTKSPSPCEDDSQEFDGGLYFNTQAEQHRRGTYPRVTKNGMSKYDSLRVTDSSFVHSSHPPQMYVRSVSSNSKTKEGRPKSAVPHCHKLNHTASQPTISPPMVPYHKRDIQRGQTYHHSSAMTTHRVDNGAGQRFKYPDSSKRGTSPLVKTQSPKSPLSSTFHYYDEVEFIEDGATVDDVLTDDDISIPSPTPPVTPVTPVTPRPSSSQEQKRLSSQLSHSNLVQLIITDEGPLLVPRKRSLTADSSLRKPNQKLDVSERAASAMESN